MECCGCEHCRGEAHVVHVGCLEREIFGVVEEMHVRRERRFRDLERAEVRHGRSTAQTGAYLLEAAHYAGKGLLSEYLAERIRMGEGDVAISDIQRSHP